MKKVSSVSLVLILFAVGVFLSGCGSEESKPIAPAAAATPVEPAPAPAPPLVPKPKPQPVVGECGPSAVSRGYPYGDGAVIRLEKTMPKEVAVNTSFQYSIKVTNLTDVTVRNVVVTENVPKNFKLTDSNPTAKEDGSKLMWMMESLAPKATEEIKVVGMATSADCLKHCATVTYVIPACANVHVVQPELKLTKTAPAEVLICEPIPVKFDVTNSGSGAATDVKIVDTLPASLKTSDGKSEIIFNAGTLAIGQSKQFSVQLKASKTGKYVNKAVASAPGGLESEATTTTVVRQPVLKIDKTAPKKLYLGRALTYEITVTNTGDAAASNTVVKDTIPQEVTGIQASAGAKRTGSEITWELGTLAPEASKKVTVSYTPTKAAVYSNKATATAHCADEVSASASTSVEGIPAILLEVIDLEDPIEVGSLTTYVITATNQGSSVGTNIQIVCTLEENVQYLSSRGATPSSVDGNTVRFTPLASLAPEAEATWRVVVKAVKPGDVLFKVSMTSAEFSRAVEETESTNLYE